MSERRTCAYAACIAACTCRACRACRDVRVAPCCATQHVTTFSCARMHWLRVVPCRDVTGEVEFRLIWVMCICIVYRLTIIGVLNDNNSKIVRTAATLKKSMKDMKIKKYVATKNYPVTWTVCGLKIDWRWPLPWKSSRWPQPWGLTVAPNYTKKSILYDWQNEGWLQHCHWDSRRRHKNKVYWNARWVS